MIMTLPSCCKFVGKSALTQKASTKNKRSFLHIRLKPYTTKLGFKETSTK